tara:strand:+ start:123 stop:671 length:549 start_codon:yes stop_codon:yes gene_type:complete
MATSFLGGFVIVPPNAQAAYGPTTQSLTKTTGPSGLVKYVSPKLETTCTLETQDGQLAYFMATNGDQYISSANAGSVATGVEEIGNNPKVAGKVIASANVPKNRWNLNFGEPALTPANEDEKRVRVTRSGYDSNWQVSVNNVKPPVNANQKATYQVDVRFKKRGYYPEGVYRAQLLVECLGQ